MSDINVIVERGRKRYGAAEFDAASQVCLDAHSRSGREGSIRRGGREE